VVRRHRKQPVRQPAKAPPVSTWLAPLPRVVAAAGSSLPAPANERDHPYLWLAGIALAVLAAAGLSLQTLSLRYYDLRFE
jgi:membrane protease YdiL (CAAX protease family)